MAPHSHDGGILDNGVSKLSITSPSLRHLTFHIFPCSSTIFLFPAFWGRPSTFCVINRNSGNLFSILAITSCPLFGFKGLSNCLLQSFHSHTSLGLDSKASGVASSSALKFLHNPSSPLNVGTPLSADIPAPVRTATLFAERSAFFPAIVKGINNYKVFSHRFSQMAALLSF